MKKLVSLLLAILLLASMSTLALAGDPMTPPPTEGNPASGNSATASHSTTFISMSSALAIQIASCGITEVSSAYLKLSANTGANNFCDKITNYYYLQRWSGSAWVNYYTTSVSGYDLATFVYVVFKDVAHGYYYRLHTLHYAFLGSDVATDSLYTDYIYVN